MSYHVTPQRSLASSTAAGSSTMNKTGYTMTIYEQLCRRQATQQIKDHDKSSQDQKFTVGSTVFARDYR